MSSPNRMFFNGKQVEFIFCPKCKKNSRIIRATQSDSLFQVVCEENHEIIFSESVFQYTKLISGVMILNQEEAKEEISLDLKEDTNEECASTEIKNECAKKPRRRIKFR